MQFAFAVAPGARLVSLACQTGPADCGPYGGGIFMRIDRLFFATALVFALIGMALGQYMGL